MSRLGWFMILFGTPITLILSMTYLPLIKQNVPQFVFYSCLLECISTGIFGACLIGLVCSRLFRFDLGTTWAEIVMIRTVSSNAIIVTHPISLMFVDWNSVPAMTMTVAWIVASVDMWLFCKGSQKIEEPSELSEP